MAPLPARVVLSSWDFSVTKWDGVEGPDDDQDDVEKKEADHGKRRKLYRPPKTEDLVNIFS